MAEEVERGTGGPPKRGSAQYETYLNSLSDYDRRQLEPDKWSPYGTMVGGPQQREIPGGGGGAGGVGSGDFQQLEYDMAKQAEGNLPNIIGLAGRETRAIQEGAQGIPLGQEGYSIPLMQSGLERQISAPGMSPVEYSQAKRRITQGFGAQTGALASAGAKGGYFDPSSVAQAGGGAPAQQLGQGFAELEAKNAEIQRREREAGVRTLASQYGTLSGRAYGAQDAFNARVGQYQEQTPVRRQGVTMTKPSSTAPPSYSSLPSNNSYGSGNLNFQHRFG